MTDGGPELVSAVEAMISTSLGVTSTTLAATPSASDLTLSQWRLLAIVTRRDAPIRLGALAAATRMSPPSASRMLARLVTRGLVASVPEADDRRAVRIEPTDRGRAVVAEVIAGRQRLIARAIARAAPPSALGEQLHRLAEALNEEESHEDRARRATDGGDPAPPLRRHRTGRRVARRRAVRPRP